jgi:uncharacterized protein (DUF1697 family)
MAMGQMVIRRIVLLRGVNVGGANRISMAALRDSLERAGFTGVRTYLQSGNVVLADPIPGGPSAGIGNAVRTVRTALPNAIEETVEELLLAEFGLDVPVISRTLDELAATVAANPFPEQALENPKALQVTFRSEPVTSELLDSLEARKAGGELIAGAGRELYSWHPDGIARSKLALALTPKGERTTARNWQTVTALHRMASDAD